VVSADQSSDRRNSPGVASWCPLQPVRRSRFTESQAGFCHHPCRLRPHGRTLGRSMTATKARASGAAMTCVITSNLTCRCSPEGRRNGTSPGSRPRPISTQLERGMLWRRSAGSAGGSVRRRTGPCARSSVHDPGGDHLGGHPIDRGLALERFEQRLWQVPVHRLESRRVLGLSGTAWVHGGSPEWIC
jgi:hypothetical protein